MVVNVLLLIVGFIILIKCADFFIESASSIAQKLKISKTLVGLTIIAFGTSLPEFAISMSALANNRADMLLGNVIGSNILNILLILGVAAIIRPISIKTNTLKKELPFVMLISTVLITLFLDIKLSHGIVNEISRADGIIILLFFSIFVYYLVTLSKTKNENADILPKYSLFKSVILFVLGLVGVIIGSNLIVNNASLIAKYMGISDRLISLTIIAIGTSLPELVTTVVAAKKSEQDMLVGNIIGSNIFNICVVLGIPVTIYGALPSSSFLTIDLIMFIASAVLLFIFAITKKKITRIEGLVMFITFIIYYISIILIK